MSVLHRVTILKMCSRHQQMTATFFWIFSKNPIGQMPFFMIRVYIKLRRVYRLYCNTIYYTQYFIMFLYNHIERSLCIMPKWMECRKWFSLSIHIKPHLIINVWWHPIDFSSRFHSFKKYCKSHLLIDGLVVNTLTPVATDL